MLPQPLQWKHSGQKNEVVWRSYLLEAGKGTSRSRFGISSVSPKKNLATHSPPTHNPTSKLPGVALQELGKNKPILSHNLGQICWMNAV